MPLTHYTVGYHDANQEHHEICEYARDSFEAIQHSKEDVPELKDHPSFVDYCTNNSGIEYLMGVVPMGRWH